MIVEFIIDKKDYQNYIKNVSLKASNGLVIAKKNKKAEGKDNFYLTLSISESSLETAQALSEVYESVNKILKEKNVKFYVLTNEASQLFVKELYPLACQFETTLRKFIYCTLFDINEKATDEIVEKMNKTIGNKEGDTFKNIPYYDLFGNATFKQICNFLFSNDDFFNNAKETVAQIVNKYNRCFTKEILIKEIENIEENTVWNKIFANKFGDSVLPQIYESLIDFRNDIMHFHYIGYQTYLEASDTLKKGIEDLRTQINKQIVIEATEENVKNLSNNSNYIYDVLNSFNFSNYSNLTLDTLNSLKMPSFFNPTWDLLNSLEVPSLSNPTLDILNSLKMPSFSNPTWDLLNSLKVPSFSNSTLNFLNSIKKTKSKELDSSKLPETMSPVSEQEDAKSSSEIDKSKNNDLSSIPIEPTDNDKK